MNKSLFSKALAKLEQNLARPGEFEQLQISEIKFGRVFACLQNSTGFPCLRFILEESIKDLEKLDLSNRAYYLKASSSKEALLILQDEDYADLFHTFCNDLCEALLPANSSKNIINLFFLLN